MDNYEWNDIFYVNIPVCILATILTIVFIDRKEGEGQHRKTMEIDYIGISLLTLGIGNLQYILEKGESENWFESRTINTMAGLSAIGLIGFIWRELTTEHPVINLKIFKNKVFAMSTVFNLVSGFGLFTSVFIYPIMVQRINGLSSTETGLSLMYPTLLGVILFPMIAKYLSLGGKPIPVMGLGICIFIIFGFIGGSATPEMGRWDFFPMHLLRMMGVAMLQMPLINQAVAGLQPSEYPAGIALSNMIRQLGGAFGIAVANNYATHRAAQHRTDLLANIQVENPLFQQRIQGLTQNMMQKTGDLVRSGEAAYRQLDAMVNKQAYYLAYLDTFRLVSILFMCILPFLWLLRTPKKTKAEIEKIMKASEEAH